MITTSHRGGETGENIMHSATIRVDIDTGMITAARAAEILGVTEERLAELRLEGKGPAYVAIAGDIVRYYEHVVESWVDQIDRVYSEEEW